MTSLRCHKQRVVRFGRRSTACVCQRAKNEDHDKLITLRPIHSRGMISYIFFSFSPTRSHVGSARQTNDVRFILKTHCTYGTRRQTRNKPVRYQLAIQPFLIKTKQPFGPRETSNIKSKFGSPDKTTSGVPKN